MEILLQREPTRDDTTLGRLTIEGSAFACDTLEDAIRPAKLKGRTAIAAGRYEVVITFSARFQKPLPLLLRVPEFEGVRIHAGRTKEDTEGCILVGSRAGTTTIVRSRATMRGLLALIQNAANREKIWITLADPIK